MKRPGNVIVILLTLCSVAFPQGLRSTASSSARATQSPGGQTQRTLSTPAVPASITARLKLFEKFVVAQMKRDKIPGMTIGFKKDDVSWVKGFGYADLENKVPAKPESAYRLASITKTMTGTAILQLVERGKMKLDEEIQTYVPYYPKQKWAVTVRQLLVHLGGGQTGSGIGPEYVSPREVVDRIAKYPIKNEPGVKFDYQTSGYNLLGAAIEEVSGKSFGEYLQQNIWTPIGMKDTRMDNVREFVPNRVRGYVLVKGDIKNAPFLDVSSRFGGGGANGTVPDLLRWASTLQRAKILSKSSLELMFTPVANKSGHYVGIDDDTWHYTLGWQVFPVNGQFVFYNDGGQTGTNTMVLHLPSANLSIAFACNLQDIDRGPYVRRLYYAVTGLPWDAPVYTSDKLNAALMKAVGDTFNFGSLYFDQFKRPETNDAQQLASAFAYFNKYVNRGALEVNFKDTVSALNDGRHPVAGTAFIKVGSYMAMKLRERHRSLKTDVYHTMGALRFFAEYVEMYKTSPGFPKEYKFSETLEGLVENWNRDWTRTWTEYSRQFLYGSNPIELRLAENNFKKLFADAEVYPNLIGRLLELRQSFEAQKDWLRAAEAAGVAAELYPQSDVTNAYNAISLTMVGKPQEAEAALRKGSAINANGIASPRAANQIGLAISGINVERAIDWLKLALEVYPREANLFSTLGDMYLKQGTKQPAVDAYKKALELDPDNAQAKEALKKLTK